MSEQKRRVGDLTGDMDPHNYGLIALTKIEAHEEICAVRYNQIDGSLRAVFGLLWKSAGTLIVLQVSAIAALTWYVLTHGNGK